MGVFEYAVLAKAYRLIVDFAIPAGIHFNGTYSKRL